MERNRYIHSLRESSYKINIEGRRPDEDLTVNVYGMDGGIVGTYHFDPSQLQGKKSIHFKYRNGKVEWFGGIVSDAKIQKRSKTTFVVSTNRELNKEAGRDEIYVIELCDEILGLKAKRQHRFPFLLGDSGKELPVDAYYEEMNLVVEYCERQRSEAVPFFDRRLTISGVGRGEQRRIYDERRREILPQHGIRLVSVSYSDFEYDSRKRIIRDRQRDIQIIRNKLEV